MSRVPATKDPSEVFVQGLSVCVTRLVKRPRVGIRPTYLSSIRRSLYLSSTDNDLELPGFFSRGRGCLPDTCFHMYLPKPENSISEC